jgi:hypothetical protein
MRNRAMGMFATLAISLTLAAQPASPAPQAEREDGLFLNILPAGQGHSVTVADALGYELTGATPPDWTDQLDMYRQLPLHPGKITDGNLTDYFKSAPLGLDRKDALSIDQPKTGVTILRDKFGVPHIYGTTRNDAMWAAGYVTAEDRLFFADVLRHVGRGRLSAGQPGDGPGHVPLGGVLRA